MIQADITNGSGLSEEHQQSIKRVKKNLCLVLVQVHWSSSMIMSRHRSLGFRWGQALALWVRTQLFPAGDRVRPREKQKAVGGNVQELTHHHQPQHGVQAQFWLKCSLEQI